MELDLGIEVSEIGFDKFERRKAQRVNGSLNEIKSIAQFANKIYKAEQIQIEFDLGIEVREITFDLFERRKVPRENRLLV